MKKHYAILIAICLMIGIIAPIRALPTTDLPTDTPAAADQAAETPPAIRVLLTKTDQIAEIPAREYVFGVVAAEMSMSCHDQALMAQAVAAYTYALYKSQARQGEEWDVTDDPAQHQAYITRAAAAEKWGDRAEEYSKRLDEITQATQGLVITYQNQPILAAYHDTSAGRTLSSNEVWGKDYPYLVAVESAGDLLSPSYRRETTLTAEKFAEICESVGIKTSGEAEEWVKEAKYSQNGRVESLAICQSSLSGADARKIFDLPSTSFDLKYADGSFTFVTRGSGHGVGMSQSGANYMALCGSDYAAILAWYYPGTAVEKYY